MAPRLSVVFRGLVRLVSFPPWWRQAYVNPIPKDPPSSSVANYRTISRTSVLSKVFELLVPVRLGRFMERNGMLPTTCTARIVQIDFSVALDRVNHRGILYRLCSMGIWGSVLSILTQFLSNRSQYDMVDGCRSKLVDVVSGVPQSSVLGPLLFLLNTSELFSILENKINWSVMLMTNFDGWCAISRH